jgi:hypothetical protein
MRDGAVEMQAMLQRGDFDFLNRQWPELQQQLEQRGIHLAPLTCDPSGADAGGTWFQRPGGRHAEDDAIQPGPIAEFVLAGALKPPAIPRTGPVRGWESWA